MKTYFALAVGLLAAFVLWTAALCMVDIQSIGPQGSAVGLATMNQWFHRWTGVHMELYDLTDNISLIPLALAAGFGLLGLCQWIQRKDLRKVDRSLLVLGGFYVVVLAAFVGFELAAINYRPILIEGRLEASYPSSTTMLALCILPTAAMQLRDRIRQKVFRGFAVVITAYTVFMVIGRLVSGVHWFSDIIGGALLSAGLVLLYRAVVMLSR